MANIKELPHTEIILKEMFRRVDKKYSDTIINKPGWYSTATWTEQEQDKFTDWLINYLKENKDARKEIMNTPSKKFINNVVNEFILNYGWKVKQDG